MKTSIFRLLVGALVSLVAFAETAAARVFRLVGEAFPVTAPLAARGLDHEPAAAVIGLSEVRAYRERRVARSQALGRWHEAGVPIAA